MEFYFEIAEDGVVALDPHKIDLVDAEVVRYEALRTLGEMVKSSAVHGSMSRITVSVRNDKGQKVVECSASVQLFD